MARESLPVGHADIDAGAYLHQISCPVLVLLGRQEEWSPLAQHEDMAERISDAELAITEDAGHFAPVEKPAEVAAVIQSWMMRHLGSLAGRQGHRHIYLKPAVTIYSGIPGIEGMIIGT